MTGTPATFDAGRPRFSGPIRRLAKPFGPLARPIAGTRWFPLCAILHHTGRTSGNGLCDAGRGAPDGRRLHHPAPVRRCDAMGEESVRGWRRLAPSTGGEYQIGDPRIVEGEAAAVHLPPLIRFLARRLGLRQYVLVRRIRT